MLRKLLILSVLLFTFIFASAAVAAEQIRIGIVVGQATAELSCEDEFTVRDSSGKTTTMPKGKYFIHAQQGMLNRTSRGRMATRETYRYLGIPFPENQ